jgi:adenosine deaminase
LRSVESLGLSRVGHGVSAVNDQNVLAELSARGIGFEGCLSSNFALGLYARPENHPLPNLIRAGCKVSLATDDPAYFQTTPANEYRLAAEDLAISQTQLHQVSLDAIDMAFCDRATKDSILDKMPQSTKPTETMKL